MEQGSWERTANRTPAREAVSAWLEWYDLAGVDASVQDDWVALASRLEHPTLSTLVGDGKERRPLGRGQRSSPMERAAGAGTEGAASARALASACRSLAEIENVLRTYDGCPLRATATQLCFADGSTNAPVMLIGEAPGAEEDRQGKPFVGQSGRLLDRMLAAIGLDRSRVWITNIVFWRPPGNRPPTTSELAICQPFLERQIELLSPRCIVLLGGAAARAILGVAEGVGTLRGRRLQYEPRTGAAPIPAIVTYHPANLLRSPLNKRFVWRDFLRLRAELEAAGAIPEPANPRGDQPPK